MEGMNFMGACVSARAHARTHARRTHARTLTLYLFQAAVDDLSRVKIPTPVDFSDELAEIEGLLSPETLHEATTAAANSPRRAAQAAYSAGVGRGSGGGGDGGSGGGGGVRSSMVHVVGSRPIISRGIRRLPRRFVHQVRVMMPAYSFTRTCVCMVGHRCSVCEWLDIAALCV